MYIKQIIIQGFKSYKDQTLIDPFSPKHNLIGSNGSGKSNFFNAIMFVLSEKYTKLTTEERQGLLHEGAGRSMMTAFVEIIFDNSDNRLPFDKKEVSIRRTIGMKKDEYRVEGKQTTQREVMNLLETAGFSSSNPYYIVEQGKVSKLTTMKDKERLDLLKEVAGTRVYDERRKESLKIMQETDSKKQKIDEVVAFIEERLKELEKECNELKEYQTLDKTRRLVEHVILSRQNAEAQEQLDKLESSRSKSHESTNTLYNKRYAAQEELRLHDRALKEGRLALAGKQKERELLEDERQDKIRARAKMDLEIKDQQVQKKSGKENKSKASKELDALRKRIDATKKKLEDAKASFDKASKKEQQATDELSTKERRLNELFSKQGRKLKFKTKQERDTWIDAQIKESQGKLKSDQEHVTRLEKEIADLTELISKFDTQSKEKNKSIDAKKKNQDALNVKFQQSKKKRDDLTNERKTIWKQQNESEQKFAKLKEELSRSEKTLEHTVGKSVSKGLESVKRIQREQNIKGVHGTILELFSVNDKYKKAAEVAAGNSLFNVVVENEQVAATILDIMNRQKAPGRVAFMPLNKLQIKPVAVPVTEDFIPLIKKLDYDIKYQKAFEQIFSKTYVCKALEDGSKFAREHGVNCITLKGDQVNRKGALTGGYYDFKQSRIDAMKTINQSKDTLGSSETDTKKLTETLADLDTQVNAAMAEYTKIEGEMRKEKNVIDQESMEVKLIATREKSLRDALAQTQQTLTTMKTSVKRAQESIDSLKAEKSTPLEVNLTNAERDEQQNLTVQVEQLKKDCTKAVNERVEAESTKNELSNQLSTNLMMREQQLQDQLNAIEADEQDVETGDLQADLTTLQQDITSIEKRHATLEEEIATENKTVEELAKKVEETRLQEQAISKSIEDQANSLEKMLNSRKILIQKRDDAIAQVRELGATFSEKDRKEYEDKSTKALTKTLHKSNEDLKKFGHINKKALDQYEQFTQQKKDFAVKKKELDGAAKAIKDLIKVLDQRKDEAIARTFKQVAKNFADIFQELVPTGKASLIMKRAQDEEEDEEEEENKASQEEVKDVASVIKNYTGVSIKVQFPNASEARLMQQLSGGQKSLVALTLIFAIQRCDPAPFYLFDEIDSALDSTYRTAIGKLIEKQCETTQFITVTFKNELVEVADKFYRIYFKNKVSGIKPVDKNEALQVLADHAKEQQLETVQQKQEQQEDDEEDEPMDE